MIRLGPSAPTRLLALLSAACSACSFVYVSGPPSEPSEAPSRPSERCTTSVLHPVLDSVGAAIGAVNIGIAANASPGKVAWYGIEMESETGLGLGIAQLALFGAGAVYGFVQTSRCSAYVDKRRSAPEGSSEAPTWSPALAPEGAGLSNETTEASPGGPPPASAPPPAGPAPSARPATTNAPPPATSARTPSTAAFPD